MAFHRASGGAWQTWASNYAATIEPAGVSIPVGRHVFRMEIDSARRQAQSALTLRGELRFAQVRPGEDVLYYGNAAGDLEFDFQLAPAPTRARSPFAGGVRQNRRWRAMDR